ncbi:hypothetical protein PPH41_41200, partial [Burkholderia gladioli]|nr:hypothetical protein [Burkholderia gladioli]
RRPPRRAANHLVRNFRLATGHTAPIMSTCRGLAADARNGALSKLGEQPANTQSKISLQGLTGI